MNLTSQQQDAVDACINSRFHVVCGTQGTGKITVAKELKKALEGTGDLITLLTPENENIGDLSIRIEGDVEPANTYDIESDVSDTIIVLKAERLDIERTGEMLRSDKKLYLFGNWGELNRDFESIGASFLTEVMRQSYSYAEENVNPASGAP